MLHLDARSEAASVLVGLLVLLTVVEMGLNYWENRKFYEKRDTLTNIYLTILAFILNISVKGMTFFYIGLCLAVQVVRN